MTTYVRITIAAVLATAASTTATAQASIGQAQASTVQAAAPSVPIRSTLKTYTGTVTQIDPVRRLVSTRGADGQISTFEAPPALSPAELGGIRAGDVVKVTFHEGVGVRRKPAGEPAMDTMADPVTGLRTATVTVTAIDPLARTITFVGPRGRYTRAVPEGGDVGALQVVNLGDKADVTYYEYVEAISVVGMPGAVAGAPTSTPPAAPLPAPVPPAPGRDELRHRLTLSVLGGWDNQFSGKMITQSSGTYNGIPINFDETTYDEVFGRMGLFKAGIGYRITPRSEITGTFVWSSSSSQPAQVATIGAAGIPVTAEFDDYAYWGLEAGQRFFFLQTRFTPFFGYYVGLNRFTHMNADFYATGSPNLINVSDGQFFDSSWAFSFGPTGGLLIGVGPFEFMAQVEFRFMDGLSDVDPLSQAGLKDINADSSRWSVPLLLGGRIRF